MKTLYIVIHGGIFVLWSQFYFPCFIEEAKSAWRRSVHLLVAVTGEQEHWEQTQVCLWILLMPWPLVPGGQEAHTWCLSLKGVAEPPVCVFSYLSVWAQLLSFLQMAQSFREQTPWQGAPGGAYLQFCKRRPRPTQTGLSEWWLSLCMQMSVLTWLITQSRKTGITFIGARGGEMQVSCVCPAQLETYHYPGS